MDKQKLAALAALGILMLIGIGAVSADSVSEVVNKVICRIVKVLYAVAAGVALIIIVLAGIKWIASGDDPGARKSAKESVIHAILGLLIIMLAAVLVNWVVGGGTVIINPFSTTC